MFIRHAPCPSTSTKELRVEAPFVVSSAPSSAKVDSPPAPFTGAVSR